MYAGWFQDESLHPPAGSTIQLLGSLSHSCYKKSPQCIAWTDEELVLGSQPIYFSESITSFETCDTRKIFRQRYRSCCIRGQEGFDSGRFLVETSRLVLQFPLEPSAAFRGHGDIFLSQICNTQTIDQVKLFDRCDIVCVVPRDEEEISDILNHAMSQTPCAASRTYRYIHIPIQYKRRDTRRIIPEIFNSESSGLVRDPHYQIPTWPSDCVVVQDGSDYHHYRVDGYDDSGWGCAYRSTQTILSWFMNNFNLVKRIPTVEDMQQVLRQVDYAHSQVAIGTRQWIGCVESGMIMSHISNGKIIYRLLHASSLDVLEALLLTEVLNHFIHFGCPVMVGAGHFAYTIAGVSAKTQSVLVLDPHYSSGGGGTTVNNFIDRGFVGWKSIRNMFKFEKIKAEFVNVCIPYIQES